MSSAPRSKERVLSLRRVRGVVTIESDATEEDVDRRGREEGIHDEFEFEADEAVLSCVDCEPELVTEW